MAGSFNHVVENGKYIGTHLLENMGDMAEAVDMMAFMLLASCSADDLLVAREGYFRCCRGQEPWPEWWTPRDL